MAAPFEENMDDVNTLGMGSVCKETDESLMHNDTEMTSKELLKLENSLHGEDRCLEEVLCIKTKKNIPRKTFKVPQSSVLAQVKQFLPQMDAANKQLELRLQKGSPDDVDIEHVTDNQEQVVEMNLALYEQKEVESSSSDSDSESDSCSDSDCAIMEEVTTKNFKIKKSSQKGKGHLIQEMTSERVTDAVTPSDIISDKTTNNCDTPHTESSGS